MKVYATTLEGVLLIEPPVFEDRRGFFMETYQKKRYAELGIQTRFIQDNLSYSVRGTLRGLHYQFPHAQAKLVQVIEGKIYDVVVDIRRGSPTFGKWTGVYLSDENRRQLYMPEGFAHGFCVLSETVFSIYKCSELYTPDSERGIFWSDPDICIEWPIGDPLLSEKDRNYGCLKDMPPEKLPNYEEDI